MNREQLLTKYEDEVRYIVDPLPRHVQALLYKYLYAQGMRIAATDQIVREGIAALMKDAK